MAHGAHGGANHLKPSASKKRRYELGKSFSKAEMNPSNGKTNKKRNRKTKKQKHITAYEAKRAYFIFFDEKMKNISSNYKERIHEFYNSNIMCPVCWGKFA